ncbi:MAG: thermonuclease family protein [Sedimentisphaerales bacterium]|nr:thermonuclease family protein [Sedimentisphaerales bacterium]
MSKRKRATIITLCLLCAAFVVWLDHGPLRQTWQTYPGTQSQLATDDFAKYHGKTFTVTKVIDGDTLDIDVPDGKSDHTRIRLWGIDTPETKNPKTGQMYFGPEAADFAAKLALGRQVTVFLDEGNDTRGYYRRLLAYVKLPNGRFLNEVLLAEGFAYADRRFRHSSYHKHRQLEAVARRNKKGLWKDVTTEQLPEWLRKTEPNLL